MGGTQHALNWFSLHGDKKSEKERGGEGAGCDLTGLLQTKIKLRIVNFMLSAVFAEWKEKRNIKL